MVLVLSPILPLKTLNIRHDCHTLQPLAAFSQLPLIEVIQRKSTSNKQSEGFCLFVYLVEIQTYADNFQILVLCTKPYLCFKSQNALLRDNLFYRYLSLRTHSKCQF